MKSAMCELCGKAFTPGNLKKHMRMHGDNRPKKCTYCDREFPTYKAMTGHRKFAHIEQYQADRDGQLPRSSFTYSNIYRVTIHVVSNLPLTSKQMLCFSTKSLN